MGSGLDFYPHPLSQLRLKYLDISCLFFFLVIYLLLCLHSPGVQRWYKDALRPIERQRFLWVPLFGLFQGNINKSRQGRRTPLPAFPVLIQKTSVHVEAIFCQLGKAHKTGFLTKYFFILLKLETSPSTQNISNEAAIYFVFLFLMNMLTYFLKSSLHPPVQICKQIDENMLITVRI